MYQCLHHTVGMSVAFDKKYCLKVTWIFLYFNSGLTLSAIFIYLCSI